ncbi:MAG: serine/threonine-protein kinase, partial [Planctomycetota bacterium]
MASSQEFLKQFVEDHGIATRERVADLIGRVERGSDKPLATLLLVEGLVEEKDLVTILQTYNLEEEKKGNRLVSENTRFGGRLVEKGLAGVSDIWEALHKQDKERAGGTERSLDWFLVSGGVVEAEASLGVISELGLKTLVCPDCGRQEILSESDVGEVRNCPECHGQMKVGKPPEIPIEPPDEEDEDPLLGRRIGGCELESLLGKGGMGAVYKARHVSLNKPVAVKILSGALGASSARKRFLREARTAARLEHPNIVQVFDTGTEGDIYFIVMQFVEGESASTRVKREGGLPVEEAVGLILEAAKGISAAHNLGMIHRDIKPDNIMVDLGGSVKVADFGLAKDLESQASMLTATGQTMGTPHYMSPEQARDASSANASSDIYSLGATLYTLLSGRPPFSGATPWAVVSSAMNDPAPDIRESRDEVPDVLAEFVLQMMEKDPQNRPSDMAAVIDGLLAVQRTILIARGGEAFPGTVKEVTLDDFKTPAPGSIPAQTGAPEKKPPQVGPTLDDFPTPATLTRPPRKSRWLIPAVVVSVLVLAAVVVGAILVP